jgi:hypothetical protein
VIISESILFQKLGDQIVILQLEKESYYGLDEVASRMWELLHEHKKTDVVVANLLEEYDTNEETLRRDLLNLVNKLTKLNLATIEDDNKKNI